MSDTVACDAPYEEDDELTLGDASRHCEGPRSTYRVLVDAEADGRRLDAFLGAQTPLASRSLAARLIEGGDVQVNGEVQDCKRFVVHSGDRIEVLLPPTAPQSVTLEPQRIPLDIRYEDDHLIVLSKQRGLVCHPSPGHPDHTLANALLFHCGASHLGTLQGEDRPGIVHRLDMDTTGLMLAAKDNDTQAALQDAIRLRSVDRRYVTLVQGYIAPDTGIVDAPIARSTRDRLRMAVSEDPLARQSVTTFSVLERFEAGRRDDGYTLLECKLFTGRTHQIRVHMAYIHHPVVGDQLYGRGSEAANLGLDRQFLHSWSLAFDHPVSGESLGFIDPLTYELQEALESLDGRSMGRTERGVEVLSALEAAAEQDRYW
ncbi:MAG: RluA family pseudouridine synthase [Coriobacteriia bacterium]|nr:RluA family pseudouridine synthase [Coriobacteriia bacterium]